jgi:glycerol-3-phosphate acyltransferase PlsY
MPAFTILLIAASYLLGSIPFGYILVRLVRGEDVRKSGSGNIGATNVSRKSPALGVLTLLLDAMKGSAAVALAFWMGRHLPSSLTPYLAASMAALFAVLGHMFPVWLTFRGGKGVATALGSCAMVAPKAVLIAAIIFFATVLLTRYVSLGSILAVAAFPLLAVLLPGPHRSPWALACMAAVSLLVITKHRENIRRLFAGTESRFGSRRA